MIRLFAEITEVTLKALPGILDPGRDGYDDSAEGANGEPPFGEDLFEALISPLDRPRPGLVPATLPAARRSTPCCRGTKAWC